MVPKTPPLTQAQAETLAIVAYKQPISRAQIASIRGVDPDGVLRTIPLSALYDGERFLVERMIGPPVAELLVSLRSVQAAQPVFKQCSGTSISRLQTKTLK